MQERRSHSRRELNLEARIIDTSGDSESPYYFGSSQNVSTGGALIESTSSRLFDPGKRVRICLIDANRADHLRPIMLSWDAQIVRSGVDSRDTLAVKFLGQPTILPC